MNKHLAVALFSLSAVLCGTRIAAAQEPLQPVRPAGRTDTGLIVEVTLTRNLGDKVLSSTPYSLAVVQDIRSSLRIGGEVPVPSTTITPAKEDANGKSITTATPIMPYGYRPVGTFIDVNAIAAQNGQFRLSITIEDSSIYPPELAPPTTKTTGAPGFRSFKSTNSFLLRDGQQQDYAIGVDRLTGEVSRVTVKLSVEK